MSFLHPWFGLFVVPLAVIVIWTAYKRPGTLRVSSDRLYTQAGRNKMRRWSHPLMVPSYIAALGLVCFVVALMRPQAESGTTMADREAVDIMLMLDISSSMEAYDIPENKKLPEIKKAIGSNEIHSRLTLAEQALRNFMDKRPHDRFGLLVFARYAYPLSPPTFDHNFVQSRLDDLSSGVVREDGTSVTAPMLSASERLKHSKAESRIAVLFTDGRHNVDNNLSPLQAAEIADTLGIVLYTVGIGSDHAVTQVPALFDETRLRLVEEGPDQGMLSRLAEQTGGQSFRARDSEAFDNVLTAIDQMETTNIKTTRYTEHRELYPPWLLSGFILLVLSWFLQNTRLQKLP